MSNRWKWLSHLPLVLSFILVLVAALLWHARASGLNGWWWKQSGAGEFMCAGLPCRGAPDQLTVRVSNGTFRMRYYDSRGIGVTTITLPIDGRGHSLRAVAEPVSGTVTNMTCWLERKGRYTLLITRKFDEIPPKGSPPEFHQEDAWTEVWSVTPDGKRLIISAPGHPDVVYARASLWARIWRSGP